MFGIINLSLYHIIAHAVKGISRRSGLEISRRRPVRDPIAHFHAKLREFDIQTVFDVGANKGQFGKALIGSGFDKKIVSFEPLLSEHEILHDSTRGAANWIAYDRMALGAKNGEATINVAINGASSSVLDVAQTSLDAAPESGFAGQEHIKIARFDSLKLDQFSGPWAMKIDTQGLELEVLKGAGELLTQIKVILMEMSLVELYEGGAKFAELYGWMESQGYRCIGFTQGFANHQTHELLQVDGLFVR